jgi:uncharacterized protein YciI
MLFVVLFEDNADHADDIRRQHMPAHLAFLKRNGEAIKAAGPLRDGQDAPAGGLWLVEAAAPADVERLVQEDPFWPTGLRRTVRILTWMQVFADGAAKGIPAT